MADQPTRYDATSRPSRAAMELLPRYCTVVTLCPELAMGLGAPRERITLQNAAPTSRRLIGLASDRPLGHLAQAVLTQELLPILADGLDGAVLKARSPSCAIASFPLQDGQLQDGFLTATLRQQLPNLALLDEEHLEDPEARREFLLAVHRHAWRSHAQELVSPALQDLAARIDYPA